MRPFRQVAPLAGRLRTEVRAGRHYDRGYRPVQPWPQRVNTRTLSTPRPDNELGALVLDLMQAARSSGGLAARIGMQDSMKLFGARNHAFNYQVVAGDNRAISAYRDQA